MASMPHYLSVGVNDLTATGIEKAVHAMVEVLDLVMQGVQGIIIFFINFLTATYVCLITALIHGSLNVVASVTKDATKAFNDVIDSATDEIEDIAGGLEKAMNKVTKGIEDSVFGKLIPDIPKVDFSGPVDKLKHFDLNSDDFVKDARKLNKEIPSFEGVQNLTKEAVAFPFDIVRKALKDAYGSYRFNRDVFPLAQKKQMTFCSDNSTLNDFFRHLFELIHKARIVFIVVLTILAILAIAPMAWLEIWRWRRQHKHAQIITKNQQDPMDVVYIASRPYTARAGIKLASPFKGKRQTLTRWFVAYATSPPALFVLSLAFAGFFSCLCQYILLKAVQKEVPELSNKVGAFADNVVHSLEQVSQDWSNDANGVIKGLNDDVNKDVLDYVANATGAVNNTLNVFLKEMDKGLNTVFKDTILLDPIKAVLHCVIGIKIESVQKGLTWVHDHAHVDFPMFPSDVFSIGANESINGDSDLKTFLASPSTVTTDEVTGAVTHVTHWLHNNIVQEALISTGILLVYIIVVLIGMVRTMAGMAVPEKSGNKDGIRYTGDDRTFSSTHGSSSREVAHTNHEGHTMRNVYYGGEGDDVNEKGVRARQFSSQNNTDYNEKYGRRNGF